MKCEVTEYTADIIQAADMESGTFAVAAGEYEWASNAGNLLYAGPSFLVDLNRGILWDTRSSLTGGFPVRPVTLPLTVRFTKD